MLINNENLKFCFLFMVQSCNARSNFDSQTGIHHDAKEIFVSLHYALLSSPSFAIISVHLPPTKHERRD